MVITGAAGAVGCHVGQLAKIKGNKLKIIIFLLIDIFKSNIMFTGCTVIGFAGSNSKCKWLKEEMGFDYAFNYKIANPDVCLKECAPNGIDCYFDNVITIRLKKIYKTLTIIIQK